MKIRRFNEVGVASFSDYLRALKTSPGTPVPKDLIDSPRFTEVFEPIIELPPGQFETKFDVGTFLRDVLDGVNEAKLRTDVLLWTWLALYFLDELCPRDGSGNRKPKDIVKYVARPGDHRYGLDKHFVFFPWKMVTLHGESARFILSKEPGADSREQREWTGYYHNVSTPLIEACRIMYWNNETQQLRRGALTKGPGGMRRFVQVAKQLEVTYDLHGMTKEKLIELFPPREFSRWIRDTSTANG